MTSNVANRVMTNRMLCSEACRSEDCRVETPRDSPVGVTGTFEVASSEHVNLVACSL
jgi:hypothetical protein